MNWWTNLNGLQQTLWILALLSTTFFSVTTLLSFVGIGDADFDVDVDLDIDVDFDSAEAELGPNAAEALEYLSLRNIAAFALGFSWTGILFYEQLGALALLVAIPVGALFTFLNQWLTNAMKGLETSGNANLKEAIGQNARVSVEVNEKLGGKGKVVVRVRDREMELLAVTEDAESLRRGERVQVYNVENGILWVSKEDRLGLATL